ncbi:hypothetical protein V2J09_019108 [Rumex salicifolius]
MVLSRRGLVVGNYCHDVLLRDGVIVAESLGGAASFISLVLSGLSLDSLYISKVGADFKYSPPPSSSPPIIPSPFAKTTLFHAHFSSNPCSADQSDRILNRIHACDSIRPDDLPGPGNFEFGLAVGVGGEITPETLEKLVEICDAVFVDVQGLIREFDEIDGCVRLIKMKDSGFYHLLPRIRVLKASAEEAAYIDLEEVRQWCCVVVTRGENGCNLYWKGGEAEISPFRAVQVDPTGAGDSFLAGLVAGLAQGLELSDAALLGNFFGSLTVGQIGLPKLDFSLLQKVKEEVQRRKSQYTCKKRERGEFELTKPSGHDQFHKSLTATKLELPLPVQESSPNLQNSSNKAQFQGNNNCICNRLQKSIQNPVLYDEQLEPVEGNP